MSEEYAKILRRLERIENGYGSNANGEYIKFANGILICWKYHVVTDQTIPSAYGSLYQGARTYTFPVPFVAIPAPLATIFQYDTGASWGTLANITTTTITVRGIDIVSRAGGANCYMGYAAVGRWK